MNDLAQRGFYRARRLQGLELSEIVRISERARELRAAGRDVISLSTGEPDFPTPDFVIDAAMEAARRGETRYTPTAGTPALREAIAKEHGRTPAEVIVSTGAKQVLASALLGTLDPGDEVVLPTPFWTSYADMVRVAGGVPVLIPCDMGDGFKLTPERLEAAISSRTRWLMLNSPSNPSGAVYSRAQLAALAEVLMRHPQVWVISDEIYSHLSFERFTSFADAAPDLIGRTLVVSGVSKAWAMTGWRIGWGVGPEPLIRAMIAMQGQSTSGASSVGQAAALAALTGDRTFLAERRSAFEERRDMVVTALNAMPGIDCPTPEGAFYAFPSCAAHLGEGFSDGDFCARLLDVAGVAVVPGRAFGLDGHFRLSFAYATNELTAALKRLLAALEGGLR
ncbi:aminotransferase class I/II-fold pyridoxal phosphate-dependent enzyme [Alphaproteobacteria bacterium GH1-50]|uniref:Aminotransferase n=1 Tax=Kangsaoukella pontilimi TaxID=2691042 RepID=A0A7C9MV36_9RHOB|nr:pyridoxal phosphate-dependent aminotransferase [Kangsaoukella pontilimi]MXQ07380.1 aminotransferase class I/II-fold pyridoxal phosphate-dependent enzyme [Kangsaoukella pontilimi]